MRENSFLSLGPHGFHRIAYTESGSPDNPHAVVCVHGLTRNSRDFDFLAMALANDCHVVCPDVAGRGKSDWLAHSEDYSYPVYLSDMAALIARIGPGTRVSRFIARLLRRPSVRYVDWVGTSMGGLIGMMLAAQPKSPIRRLVMNDVGWLVPANALNILSDYVGKDPRYASIEQFEADFRKVYSTFGPLTEAQWRHLITHTVRRFDDGSYGFKYDPKIGEPFKRKFFQDLDLWNIWSNVRCPVLILRGAQSDFLLKETAAKMCERKAHTELVEFSGIGHAPMLMSEDQIKIVRDFLLAPDSSIPVSTG
ncbi:MAG TPA: alpha/beta hydrolase [Burkholderiales bacterium]|nr:alpha/beta hydrolase [Burkholderiales bacterium]